MTGYEDYEPSYEGCEPFFGDDLDPHWWIKVQDDVIQDSVVNELIKQDVRRWGRKDWSKWDKAPRRIIRS